MPFLIDEKAKFSKEIPLLQVPNPYLLPGWQLFGHRHFSTADDEKGVSRLPLATDGNPLLKILDLDVSEEELELLFLELREDRDLMEGLYGSFLEGLFYIKLCQPIVGIFGGWIDPQDHLINRNGLEQKSILSIVLRYLSINLNRLFPLAQSFQQFSNFQFGTKILRFLRTMFLKFLESFPPIPLGESPLGLHFK
jgi:hypothetical protein